MKRIVAAGTASLMVAIAALIAAPAGRYAETVVTDAVVTTYSMVETNWFESYVATTAMWPPEANIATHCESGLVLSNVYLRVQWRGFETSALVESTPLDYLTRSYRMESKRVYLPDVVE